MTILCSPCSVFPVPAKKRFTTLKSTKLCRTFLFRFFVILALISSFLTLPAFCQETEDSQIFISGFNAYQQKNYSTAIAKLDEVLQKYPDTPLRDMTLFWLARAHFKSGHKDDAARVMSQFSREYPDSPLKGTVEEELLTLAAQYDKGVKQPAVISSPQPVENVADAQKARAEQERVTAEKAEQRRIAAVKAEQERVAAAKAEEARIAAVAAENKRQAALKAEAERMATEKAEQERLAAEKAEQQRIAAVKAEQERVAAAKAEEERIAAVAAENKR